MGPADVLYRITSGPLGTKRILTPIGLCVFFAVMLALIWAGVLIDRLLGVGRFIPVVPGLAVGIPIVAIGVFLSAWSILTFAGERGTPVPFSPPPRLVVKGPYACCRNPMTAGLFLQLFGLGFLLGSIGLAFIVTPALIIASVIGLKRVEEPELERRLGAPYADYRRSTPMFIPRAFSRLRPHRRLTRRGPRGILPTI
jgi:protein-S-isoprenylcysteine O-methyltransferase Ste14